MPDRHPLSPPLVRHEGLKGPGKQSNPHPLGRHIGDLHSLAQIGMENPSPVSGRGMWSKVESVTAGATDVHQCRRPDPSCIEPYAPVAVRRRSGRNNRDDLRCLDDDLAWLLAAQAFLDGGQGQGLGLELLG